MGNCVLEATVKTTVLGSNPSINVPAANNGDFLGIALFFISGRKPSSAPSGWTERISDTTNANIQYAYYERVAGTSEPTSVSFTASFGDFLGFGIRWSNAKTGGTDGAENFNFSTTVDADAITLAVSGSDVLEIYAARSQAITKVGANENGTQGVVNAALLINEGATSTSAQTATIGSSNHSFGVMIEILAKTNVALGLGTFTLTGYDINAQVGVDAPLDLGSFTLTGYDLGVQQGIDVDLDLATYSLTGYDIGIQAGVGVSLDLATFSLTGFDASVTTDIQVSLDLGSFTLTGFDLNINAGLAVDLDLASFSLAGYDLGLQLAMNIDLALASFTLTGYAQGVGLNKVVDLDLATFALTGYDLTVSTSLDTDVVLDLASFILTGYDVSAYVGRVLALDLGTYSLTGYASTIAVNADTAVALDLANFTLTGYDVTVSATEAVSLDLASFTLTGYDTIIWDASAWIGTVEDGAPASNTPSLSGLTFAGGDVVIAFYAGLGTSETFTSLTIDGDTGTEIEDASLVTNQPIMMRRYSNVSAGAHDLDFVFSATPFRIAAGGWDIPAGYTYTRSAQVKNASGSSVNSPDVNTDDGDLVLAYAWLRDGVYTAGDTDLTGLAKTDDFQIDSGTRFHVTGTANGVVSGTPYSIDFAFNATTDEDTAISAVYTLTDRDVPLDLATFALTGYDFDVDVANTNVNLALASFNFSGFDLTIAGDSTAMDLALAAFTLTGYDTDISLCAIRAIIESYKTSTTLTGRQSTNSLKVPGVDTLPTGVSKSGNALNVTGTGVVFTDWDLSGFHIDCQSGGVVDLVEECISDIDSANFWVINVRSGGRVKEVKYCTFDGGDILNAGVVIQGQEGHGVEWIHRNRFLNCSNDGIKPTGSAFGEQLIEHNYIGPPKAYPNIRALWAGGTTYEVDEVACSTPGGSTYYNFISKTSSNTGNALPAHTAFFDGENTDWREVNPHADALQWIGDTIGGMRVRFNHIYWPANDYASGVTTAIYPDPPGASSMTDENYIYANILRTPQEGTLVEFPRPFIMSGNDNPWANIFIYHNWIEEKSGYNIMTGGGKDFEWGINREYGDGSLIAYDDSRLPSTGNLDWSASTPALCADWPVGESVSLALATYTLTGYDLSLGLNFNIALEAASFVLSGYDISVEATELINFDLATFALIGYDTTITTELTTPVILELGTFNLTGYDTGLFTGTQLPLELASFVLTGYDCVIVPSYWAPELPISGAWAAEDGVTDNWSEEGAAAGSWTPEGSTTDSWNEESPPSNSWTEESEL